MVHERVKLNGFSALLVVFFFHVVMPTLLLLYSRRSHEVRFWRSQCFALRGAKRKRRLSVGKYLQRSRGEQSPAKNHLL
jgi:hypothetical protein